MTALITQATSCTKTGNSQTEKKMSRYLVGLQNAMVTPVPVVSERVHPRKGQRANRYTVTLFNGHAIKLLCVPSKTTDRHRIWKSHDALTQWFPTFLTRGALFRINFYGAAP